ncbi:MAG: fucose isomerase [Oscillospiraceae bacterium]|nr:fucose isomerase [Oscillospiraceae bacterium]
MLKNIPAILSPQLLKILMEMGHGDEIVIADGNYPAASNARNLVRCDGHGVPELLEAILAFFPLDAHVDCPAALMDVPKGADRPPIWARYEEIVNKHEPGSKIERIERFNFYERGKAAYAIIATGESAIYANIILKKGVITGK